MGNRTYPTYIELRVVSTSVFPTQFSWLVLIVDNEKGNIGWYHFVAHKSIEVFAWLTSI
jgi:hypothetical protein